MFSNNLTIVFSLSPSLHAFTLVDISLYFSLNDTAFENTQFSYDSGNVTISSTFSKDLQNLPFLLSLNLSLSPSPYFSLTPNYQVSEKISSTSLFPIFSYTEDEYLYSQFLFYFGFILVGLSLTICLIGIFSTHKLAGLEVMFPIQYAFIALIWF